MKIYHHLLDNNKRIFIIFYFLITIYYFFNCFLLNDYEILTSRLIDRALRPLFPEDYLCDVQVLISLISSDDNVMPDSLACLAASAALAVVEPSSVPARTTEMLFSMIATGLPVPPM